MKQNLFRGMIAMFILFLILLVAAPKVLQVLAALIFMIPFGVFILSSLGLVVMIFFPDAIKMKENSRLLSIPAFFDSCLLRVKNAWNEVWGFLDIITNQRKMREAMDEIVSGQAKLPF